MVAGTSMLMTSSSTVVWRQSADGLTDQELRALLHVPVHSFRLASVRHGRARRERLGGVYVDLSPVVSTSVPHDSLPHALGTAGL